MAVLPVVYRSADHQLAVQVEHHAQEKPSFLRRDQP
jgi:hypothetical protein